MSKPIEKSRTIGFILYPDSESYNCQQLLNDLIHWKPDALFAYVLHDKDVTDDGEIKKPHYHVLLNLPNAMRLSTFERVWGIPSTNGYYIRDWRAQVRYLAHYDDSDKTSYDPSDIVSNFSIEPYFKVQLSEDEQVRLLFDYICKHPKATRRHILAFALDNNLYSSYRRSYSILDGIRSEIWDSVKPRDQNT